MKEIALSFICLLAGMVTGSVATYFNAPPLFHSLAVAVGVLMVMFIFFKQGWWSK